MSAGEVVGTVGGATVLLGSLFFLLSSIGVLRSRDAVSRVNNLSPAMGVGLPLIIIGAAATEAAVGNLSRADVLMALVAVAASLIVSSVASNMLGRAAYRAQEAVDPRTLSDALGPAEPSSAGEGPTGQGTGDLGTDS